MSGALVFGVLSATLIVAGAKKEDYGIIFLGIMFLAASIFASLGIITF